MIAPPLVSRPVPIESWDFWVAGLVGVSTGSVLPVDEDAAKALSEAADNSAVKARAAHLECFMRVSPLGLISLPFIGQPSFAVRASMPTSGLRTPVRFCVPKCGALSDVPR